MILGRYRQQPGERRKRGVDYTDFLEDDEEITNVTATVTPEEEADEEFHVSNIAIDPDGKHFAYFAGQNFDDEGGGVNGTTYTVEFTITTSGGQTKQDSVEFDVEEDA